MRTKILALGACLLPALSPGQTSPFVDEKTERAARQRALRRPRLRDAPDHDAVAQAVGFRRLLRRRPRRRGAREGGGPPGRPLDRPEGGQPDWTVQAGRGLARRGRAAPMRRDEDRPRCEDVATSHRRQFPARRRHRRARGRGRRGQRRRLRRQGRARQDRSRLRIAGPRDGAGRLEARRRRHPLVVVLAAQPARRRRGPDRLALASPKRTARTARRRRSRSSSRRARARRSPTACAARARAAGEPVRRRPASRCGCASWSSRSCCRSGRPRWSRRGSPAPIRRFRRSSSPAHLQEEKFSANDDQSGRREHARDRPRPDAAHRQRNAAPAAPRHPLLVVRRDLLRVPVLRRPPGRGEEGPRQPQPGHGGREAVGRPPDAVHGAHALVAAVLPLRRPGEHSRRGRGRQQRVSPGVAGRVDPAPGQAFSKPIFARLGTREPFRAQAVPYFDSTDHLVFNDSWVARSRDLADELARRVHPLLRRRPLADRPDAVEAQRLRRRGDGLVARQRGRRRRPLPRVLRRGEGRRAPRRRSRDRARPGSGTARAATRTAAAPPRTCSRSAARRRPPPSSPRAPSAPPRIPPSPTASPRCARPRPPSRRVCPPGRPPRIPALTRLAAEDPAFCRDEPRRLDGPRREGRGQARRGQARRAGREGARGGRQEAQEVRFEDRARPPAPIPRT